MNNLAGFGNFKTFSKKLANTLQVSIISPLSRVAKFKQNFINIERKNCTIS